MSSYFSDESKKYPEVKNDRKRIVLDICGMIGAGKSTSLKGFQKIFENKDFSKKWPKFVNYPIKFFFERINDTKLKDYYIGMQSNDPSVRSSAAIWYQIYSLAGRMEISQEIDTFDGICFRDRSVGEDDIFTLKHLKSGVIPQNIYDIYKKLLNSMIYLIKPTTLYIYLDASIDRCLQSIKERNGDNEKNGENTIDEEYMKELKEQYDIFRENMKKLDNFIIIDYESFLTPEQLLDIIYKQLCKRHVL